ncbi:Ubiquitin-conjugating enzyme E2 variant 3 [Acipenser ruthenus]|uniref:Ubiquitin-conjugating enzyme E2 variant 3 n=1 Tax=Acipenser ruthenus TaxID=7906 RepID=A0A444UMT6_ACIRT|nr:Ubiquitin-conjugating enzyme E2 variant 3 [Acipenser ruthenus]
MAFLARISGGVSDMTLQSAVRVGGDRAYRPINIVTVVGGWRLGHGLCDEYFRKDFSSSAGSRVVVVTANSWSNDQSYVSVVQANVDLFRGIIPSVAHYSPSAVLLITSQPEIGTDTMGKACLTVTKYFLFLFNLLFFIFGALILGFGLWILLDNQSFIAVLRKYWGLVRFRLSPLINYTV